MLAVTDTCVHGADSTTTPDLRENGKALNRYGEKLRRFRPSGYTQKMKAIKLG